MINIFAQRLFLIFALILLSGCAHFKSHPVNRPVKPAKNKPVAQIHHIHRHVDDFDKIIVEGRMNVDLHSGYSKPSIVLKGDRRDLANVIAEVKNHTLVIYAGKGVPDYAPLKVVIKGRYIHSVKYTGCGKVQGHKLRTNYLDLDLDNEGPTHLAGYLLINQVNIKGSGPVRLDNVYSKGLKVSLHDHANLKINGKANLCQLEADGNSHFSMIWVNSKVLKANIKGHAYIQLAGVINKLDACVFDNAHWNGRYLRSHNTYMKTFGNALARISAVNKQHTLALDNSNIYFYNLSPYRTDFMAYNGSVLDMRNWEVQALKDYDIFNKAG